MSIIFRIIRRLNAQPTDLPMPNINLNIIPNQKLYNVVKNIPGISIFKFKILQIASYKLFRV